MGSKHSHSPASPPLLSPCESLSWKLQQTLHRLGYSHNIWMYCIVQSDSTSTSVVSKRGYTYPKSTNNIVSYALVPLQDLQGVVLLYGTSTVSGTVVLYEYEHSTVTPVLFWHVDDNPYWQPRLMQPDGWAVHGHGHGLMACRAAPVTQSRCPLPSAMRGCPCCWGQEQDQFYTNGPTLQLEAGRMPAR